MEFTIKNFFNKCAKASPQYTFLYTGKNKEAEIGGKVKTK